MIPPQDLKNKAFTRTVRGYNPIEVEDYIKFLITKYEKLYQENAELDRRLHIVSAKYEEIADNEESIRNAVAQAQKLSEAMINSAQKAADDILEKVRTRCDETVEDAQVKVEKEKEALIALQRDAAQFRALLLEEYSKHLNLMRETNIPTLEEVEEMFPKADAIRSEALDRLIPEEIIERALIEPTQDPALDTLKRFIHPKRTRLSKMEKAALAAAREESGKHEKIASSDRVTEQIFKSSVDEEEYTQEETDEILAPAPDENQVTLEDLSGSDDAVPTEDSTPPSTPDKDASGEDSAEQEQE